MKVKLKDICTPKQWKTISTNKLKESGYPVYGANGIIGYYNEYNHEVDTLLVTCRGATCGSLNISKGKAYVNGNAMALDNLRDEIDVKYLYYYLKYRGFNDVISGSAQPQIIRSTIEEIEVEIKEKREQRKIVNKCERIERLVDKIKYQQNYLDTLIKARFVEMFGDIKKLDGIRSVKLGSICETVSGGTPSTKENDYYGGDIPWISTVALGEIFVGKEKAKDFITEKALRESATHLIPKDSIMVGTRVGVGKCSINSCDMCTNQDINSLINIDESKFNKVFLKFAIDEYCEYFNAIKKGATILGITTEDLKSINIPIVSLELQDKYVCFVRYIDKLKFDAIYHII